MVIDKFRGKYGFLSNFYDAKVKYEGLEFNSAEAAFQAMKCIEPEDRLRFVGIDSKAAKRKGKMVRLRKDWEEVKLFHMYGVTKAKFEQNEYLKQKLIETGSAELIEGNTWGDIYWGVCNGRGQNKFGKILMKVRGVINNA